MGWSVLCKQSSFRILLCISLFHFCALACANSVEWSAEVLPSQDPKESVQDFRLTELLMPVERKNQGTDFINTINLKFEFSKQDWSLLKDNDQVLPKKTNGIDFEVSIHLLSEVTPVEIIAVGPLGEVEMQKILIRVKDWGVYRKVASENPPKRSYVFTSLGFSYLHYRETSLADFSILTSTLKISYNYLLTPPQWEFNVNGFFNLLPLSKSGTSADVRFIGINVRFGYVFPFVKSPSRLSFLVGVYYSSMLGTGGAFGYKTLIYPQFYPVYRLKDRNGHVYVGYLKYVPLNKSIAPSFRERELALGGGVEFPIDNEHPLSFYLDFSDVKLNTSSTGQITNQTTSISVGYGF